MRKRKGLSYIVLLLVFLTGLSLLLYPTISDRWNAMHQTRAIVFYTQQVDVIDDLRSQAMIEAARSYNETIPNRENVFVLSDEETALYNSLLNPSDNGVMGYIEIPVIQCSLPIYHGTDENVLQVAIGHLEWSSLPVGGAGTHSVLSGHRGLPSAKLFTDLESLTVGDRFQIYVLHEVLSYEVDQILIVEPGNTDALMIEEGKDCCTLVTCTPYGINTHRLLVRGRRVENEAEDEIRVVRVMSDGIQIEPIIVATIVAVPLLILLMFCYRLIDKFKRYYLR